MRHAALLLLLLLGCNRPPVVPVEPAAPVTTPTVAAPPEPKIVDRFVAVLVARDAVDVAPRVEGPLKLVYVSVGDQVEANARIALVDDSVLRQQLALEKATLRASQASAQKASVELADARERKHRRVLAGSDVSQEELSSAQFKEQLGGSSLAEANAQVAERKAHIAQLMEQLNNTEVRSPIAGTVSVRYLGPGALVGPTKPIVRIIKSADLSVRFAVPAPRAHREHVGDEVSVNLEVLTAPIGGKVESIAPEVDSASQMVFMQATLALGDKEKRQLQSGLEGTVTLPEPTAGDGRR